jgi:hypothetical protein
MKIFEDLFLAQQVELSKPTQNNTELQSSSGCDDSDERLSSVSGNYRLT